MSEPSTSPAFVFFSYSRADSQSVKRLMTDIEAQGINVWIDEEDIEPGTPDWEQALRTAIHNAYAVLLITSPVVPRSRYIKDELRIAEMYQRHVYPIWIAGTQWMDTVPIGWGGTQYIDAREARYQEALNEIVMVLRKLQSEPPATPPKAADVYFEPRNPYKGLEAFTSEDTGDFFGRKALIDELADEVKKTLLAEKRNNDHAGLLAVVGPSGSGKSSVVMAGLLPCLQRGSVFNSNDWVYLDPIIPGVHPIESLTVALSNKLRDKSGRAIREDLLDEESTRGLHLLATSIIKRQGKQEKRVVLFVDQFEELFTLTTDEKERQRFIDLLLAALAEPGGPVIILLTLRADFSDRPMNYPELGQLIETHRKAVFPMKMEELRSAIVRPAELRDVQLTFEDSLVGELLFEVQRQAGALPLLQFTLYQLFKERDGHLLTLDSYRKIGGVEGALAKHAETTYTETLPSEEHRQLARVLFLRLIDPGQSEQDTTRRRAALTELSLPDPTQTKILQETANVFITERLLVTSETAGTPRLEVSHEALIREWPRLRDWLITCRNDLLTQQAISGDVKKWLERGKPADRLYEGTELAEAQVWMKRNTPSKDEVDFIQASMTQQEREQAALALQEAERVQQAIRLELLEAERVQQAKELELREAERAQQARELDLQKVEHERQARELGLQRVATRRQRQVTLLTVAISVLLLIALTATSVLYLNLQRSLPASVTTLNDNGPGSLRQAIAQASPGGAITFISSLRGTITLTSGEITITKNLVINGPGAEVLSISGDHRSRVFNVEKDIAVSIFGLTIKDGSTTNSGGGIANDGQLALIESIVSGNRSSLYGGGIDNAGALALTLTNSIVSGNTSAEGGGMTNFGTAILVQSKISDNTGLAGSGGIENFGTLRLTNSTVSGNQAKGGGVANPITYTLKDEKDYGGGIYNEGSLTLTNSTITGNKADKNGGGIENAFSGNVSMQFCIIAGNSTFANGGGIANRDNGTIALEYSTVSNNTAMSGAGIFTGGTIFTSASTTTELLDSTVAENIATRDGGAIDVISGYASVVYGTIALNTASTGGGIDILSGSNLVMQSSVLAGNNATTDTNMSGTLTTEGYNLIQNAAGVTFNDPVKVHSTDISGSTLTDLKVDTTLKDNGGPTKTLALLPGSPAINHIPPGMFCGSGSRYNILGRDQDQRGVTRPQGAGCDIGAYEYMVAG